MKKLKSLRLVYEDGTEKILDAAEIEASLQSALAESGLSAAPPEISPASNYLFMEWKDGWQEVMAVNGDIAELLRYYVIRRIEDKGRLVLDTGADYPELTIIERTPMDISRILLVVDSGVRSYSLEQEIEGYEGTFEAGGKKEFTKYDRENPDFRNELSTTPESIDGIKKAIAAVLADKNLSPKGLLAMRKDRRIREYSEIAGVAGIRGAKKQSDVYGFIELVLKKLAS
jgi:hypothetical protein